MAILDEIKTKLSTISNVYIGGLPDGAGLDNVVGIKPSGGRVRGGSGTYVRNPSFQIRVRNTSYQAGYALAETIGNLLHGVNGETHMLLIEQESDIMDIGRDESGRSEFTINFRAIYSE